MKKSVCTFLVLVLTASCAFTAFAADPEKIAVAAEGQAPSSQVNAVAARCPYFLLFDEKGTFIETAANRYKDTPGGAGSQAVDFLAGKGVTVVIAGAFGHKMVDAMKARGMRHLEFKGCAAEAVRLALAK